PAGTSLSGMTGFPTSGCLGSNVWQPHKTTVARSTHRRFPFGAIRSAEKVNTGCDIVERQSSVCAGAQPPGGMMRFCARLGFAAIAASTLSLSSGCSGCDSGQGGSPDLTQETADMAGNDLAKPDLTGADMTGMDLSGADLTTPPDLTGADLTPPADLTGA